MNKFTFFFIPLLFSSLYAYTQLLTPTGHSHNDYLQNRPLYQAIELGYGSIEIDVCLDKNNNLKVAHIPWFLSGKKNIEEMYFAPIAKMINEKDSVFKYTPYEPLNLLIDFKKNADSTYKYLKPLFVKYANYITQYKNGKIVHQGYLEINITGNKPWKALKKDSIWFAKIDGPLLMAENPADVSKGFNSIDTSYIKLMGRAASNYKELKKIRKKFNTEEEFYKAIKSNVELYQQNKITTRYYGVPNNEKSWIRIINCGIDWINVDKLKTFSDFYNKSTTK